MSLLHSVWIVVSELAMMHVFHFLYLMMEHLFSTPVLSFLAIAILFGCLAVTYRSLLAAVIAIGACAFLASPPLYHLVSDDESAPYQRGEPYYRYYLGALRAVIFDGERFRSVAHMEGDDDPGDTTDSAPGSASDEVPAAAPIDYRLRFRDTRPVTPSE